MKEKTRKMIALLAAMSLLPALLAACGGGGAPAAGSRPRPPASQSAPAGGASRPAPSASVPAAGTPAAPAIKETEAKRLPPVYAQTGAEISWGDFLAGNDYDADHSLFAADGSALYFTVSSDERDGFGIGRYDERTQTAELIDFYRFNIGGDERLIVDNRYLFMAPITYVQDNGAVKQMMQLMMFDIEGKTHRVVYEHQAFALSNSIERIGEEEILLFFHGVEQIDGEEALVQKVVKYNFARDTHEEILRHASAPGEDLVIHEKLPFYMTVADGKILLLLYENSGQNLKGYIRELTADGKPLREIPADVLADYGGLNANTIFVANGHCFFYYYYAGKGMDVVAIARETENGLERLRFSGQSPSLLMHDGLVRGRYAYYRACPNDRYNAIYDYDYDVFVFDTLTSAYWYVKLDGDDPQNIGGYYANENGDIYCAPGYNPLSILKFPAEDVLVYE